MGQAALKYLNDPDARREYYNHVAFPVVTPNDLIEFRERCFRYVTYHRYRPGPHVQLQQPSRFLIQKSAFETLITQPGTVFQEKDWKNLRLLFAILEIRFGEPGVLGVDLRMYCSALAAFVDKPMSEKLELCFRLFDMDDDPKNQMNDRIMEAILVVVAEFVQAIWDEGSGRPHFGYTYYQTSALPAVPNNITFAPLNQIVSQQQSQSHTGSRSISSARNPETVNTSRSTLFSTKLPVPNSGQDSFMERNSVTDRLGGDVDVGRSSSISFDVRQSFLSIASSQTLLTERISVSNRPSIVGSYANGGSSDGSHSTIPGADGGTMPTQVPQPVQPAIAGFLESLTDEDRTQLDKLFYLILDPLKGMDVEYVSDRTSVFI